MALVAAACALAGALVWKSAATAVQAYAAAGEMRERARATPGPVPLSRATAALIEACDAMETGTWRVRAWNGREDNTGTLDERDPLEECNGVFVGANGTAGYDFMIPGGKQGNRFIGMNGRVWVSRDAGKTWYRETAMAPLWCQHIEMPSRLKAYPGLPDENYTTVGKEAHGGETWLHIRFEKEGNRVWLLLDAAGRPLYVRRWVRIFGPTLSVINSYDCIVEDFEPAKPGEKVEAPAGAP